MNRRHFLLLTSSLAALLPMSAEAGGKKGEKVDLSFHIEADPNDNPKMVVPQFVQNQQRYFRRVPDIATRDIESFKPFQADDGVSNGLVLKLTDRAARRLSALTTSNLDRWLLATVNGRTVDTLMIDRPINDGILVIWKGVSAADITNLDKALPRIGQPKKKG